MNFAEKILYHQIHPLKLSTDIISGLAALWVYWQHMLIAGLALTFIPPIIASVAVISLFDLDYLKTSPLGRYLQKHMTKWLGTVRLLANFGMLSGAWYHSWAIILTGAVIIAACWFWGMALDLLATV